MLVILTFDPWRNSDSIYTVTAYTQWWLYLHSDCIYSDAIYTVTAYTQWLHLYSHCIYIVATSRQWLPGAMDLAQWHDGNDLVQLEHGHRKQVNYYNFYSFFLLWCTDIIGSSNLVIQWQCQMLRIIARLHSRRQKTGTMAMLRETKNQERLRGYGETRHFRQTELMVALVALDMPLKILPTTADRTIT